MQDYSARDNPRSVSQEALQGNVRVIGVFLILPYDHPPHSNSCPTQEEEQPETLYGIPRDMAPYNQTVIGTTTLTSQALEASRTLRTQIHQLMTAAEVIEDGYRLLLSLQSATQHLAEAAPKPEYAKAVSRNRHWVPKY